MLKALLFHGEKCIGCSLCRLACSGQNEGEFNPRLARLKVSHLYTVKGLEVVGRTCDLCLECVKVCPENAILEKNGRLSFDTGLCTDCGICVDSCPNNVIVVKSQGVGVCVQCRTCASWCPTEALTFEEVSS